MSLPEFFFFGVVLLVGLPSGVRLGGSVRNLTALALSLQWFAGWGVYMLTGVGMPIFFMWIIDCTVIAAIIAKDEYTDLPGWRNQISPWDRAILAIFPVAWFFYVVPIDPYGRYWTLYILALAQFALASWEALNPWLRAVGQRPRRDSTDTSGFQRRRLAGYG